MDDLFQSADDSMEVEPDDMAKLVEDVFVSHLAKKFTTQYEKPWTDKNEAEMQERIALLVATADARGLQTIRLHVTRKDGTKVSTELDLDRIRRSRSLQ